MSTQKKVYTNSSVEQTFFAFNECVFHDQSMLEPCFFLVYTVIQSLYVSGCSVIGRKLAGQTTFITQLHNLQMLSFDGQLNLG